MKTHHLKSKDNELLDRIRAKIKWDIRVSNSDIWIRVKNGSVELEGVFDRAYRQTAALNIIASTEGVVELKNSSKVAANYIRSDKEIEFLIQNQLSSQQLTLGEWIDVKVLNGVVTLEGRVFRSRLKAAAAKAAWELSGVNDCLNTITIQQAPEAVQSVQKYYFFDELKLTFGREMGVA